MGVLNDFNEKAKGVAAAATDKAKAIIAAATDTVTGLVNMTKINVAIAGEQKEIDKNCLAIGQWFVSDYEGEIPDGIKELVDAVNASKATIAELEASKPVKEEPAAAEAEKAAEGKPCPVCGEVSDTKFCPHCGAPMGE